MQSRAEPDNIPVMRDAHRRKHGFEAAELIFMHFLNRSSYRA